LFIAKSSWFLAQEVASKAAVINVGILKFIVIDYFVLIGQMSERVDVRLSKNR
jgi:hypothetical protein